MSGLVEAAEIVFHPGILGRERFEGRTARGVELGQLHRIGPGVAVCQGDLAALRVVTGRCYHVIAEMVLLEEGEVGQQPHIHLDRQRFVCVEMVEKSLFSFFAAGGEMANRAHPAALGRQHFQAVLRVFARGISAPAHKGNFSLGLPVDETDAVSQAQ